MGLATVSLDEAVLSSAARLIVIAMPPATTGIPIKKSFAFILFTHCKRTWRLSYSSALTRCQGVRFLRMSRRVQIARQKTVHFLPGFLGEFGIGPVEIVSAGRILVDFVFKLLAASLQGIDQVLDLENVHVFVIGVAMD